MLWRKEYQSYYRMKQEVLARQMGLLFRVQLLLDWWRVYGKLFQIKQIEKLKI